MIENGSADQRSVRHVCCPITQLSPSLTQNPKASQITSSLFELNWFPALGAADAALAAVPLPVHVAGRRRPEVVQLLRVELKGEVEQCLSANIAGLNRSYYTKCRPNFHNLGSGPNGFYA